MFTLYEPWDSHCIWIATGPAERGHNHAVVCKGDEVFHDPHPSEAGLLSITSAMFLVADPGLNLRQEVTELRAGQVPIINGKQR